MELFLTHHEEFGKKNLSKGTLKNYGAAEAYLRNYLYFIGKKDDILLNELDYDFIQGFDNYLLTNPIKSHDPCGRNGAAKHVERLKGVVKWGVKPKKWLKVNPFDDFY